MKKILSVILVAVLILFSVPVTTAFADTKEYNKMLVDWGYEVRIDEPSQVLYYCYEVKYSGYYSFYSFCSDDDPYVRCYDKDFNLICVEDNSGFDKNFAFNRYMNAGDVYYFEVCARITLGDYARFGIEIRDISSSITTMQEDVDYEITTRVDYDREYFEFTPKESGYYEFMSFMGALMDIDAVMYDSNWNYIAEDDCSGGMFDFNLAYYLEAGKKYYYTSLTDYYMMKDTYFVRVRKCNPVVDINVLKNPDKMVYYNGYVEQTADFSSMELELVRSNGTKEFYSYDEDTYVYGTAVDVQLKKDENDNYYIDINTSLANKNIDVQVIDCPVDRIEVEFQPVLDCIEDTDGYVYFDKEKNDNWFVYKYVMPSDLLIRIFYTDGTSVVKNFEDKYDGMSFTHRDNQLKGDKWSVGKNEVVISYYDKECIFYVDVIENPVLSLTLNKAPTNVYPFYAQMVDGQLKPYVFYPTDIEGISFDVNYKDGTSKTITDADWIEHFGTLDGYRYYVGDYSMDAPGKTKVMLKYLGHVLVYDVCATINGDVDGDFTLSVLDATKVQQTLVGIDTINSDYKKFADFDCDYQISVLDATAIQKYLVNNK